MLGCSETVNYCYYGWFPACFWLLLVLKQKIITMMAMMAMIVIMVMVMLPVRVVLILCR